ncbi:MAG: FMN-binding protein [Melioribacteraceae bacterium]|nr:FMN-binding protein [Melioribacteraceae bacterium]
MKKLYIYFILIQIILQSNILAGEIRDSALTFIQNKYGADIEIKTFKLVLPEKIKLKSENFAKQRFFGSFVYYYEIYSSNKKVASAFLDNVLGKVKPITYMVVFNKDLSISSVDIVKYREQYGGAVGNKEWLDQFNLKTVNSDLELHKDVDGISGATISVKSVIKGVKRLVYLMNNLSDDEKDLLVSIE